MAPEEARRQIGAFPGLGPWSTAEIAIVALGDADAVSVGDLPTSRTPWPGRSRARRGAPTSGSGAARSVPGAPGTGHPADRGGGHLGSSIRAEVDRQVVPGGSDLAPGAPVRHPLLQRPSLRTLPDERSAPSAGLPGPPVHPLPPARARVARGDLGSRVPVRFHEPLDQVHQCREVSDVTDGGPHGSRPRRKQASHLYTLPGPDITRWSMSASPTDRSGEGAGAFAGPPRDPSPAPAHPAPGGPPREPPPPSAAAPPRPSW